MKPLYISKSKRIPGLVTYCTLCNTNVYETCRETGKHLKKCPHPEKHRFKIYCPIPGTTKRITKTFTTRNLKEAIIQAIGFKEPLKEKNLAQNKEGLKIEPVQTTPPTPPQPNESTINNGSTIPLLTEAMARYVGFLHGDANVPSFQRKTRSLDHCRDVGRCILRFVDCLKRSSYDARSLRIDQINREMVGLYYDYLQNEKKYGNRSLNKNIGFMKSFYLWLYKEGYDVKNPFALVAKRPEYHNPQATTKEEFEALLKIATPENGILYCNGVKQRRNVYRNYLIPGFKLITYTGRRREEVINMKFSDILKDKNGNPVTIAVPDRKVNAIQARTGVNQKVNYVPVTEQLLQLLNELGYEKYKDTDRYILAPEIKTKRTKEMADNLSRAFSHYIKLVSDRPLSMKSLRKAYLTAVQIYTGDAKIISGHSGNAVLETHYLDKESIAKSLRNFEVFGRETERTSELNTVRENHNGQEISLNK